jgi:serine/threonine-protein kinase
LSGEVDVDGTPFGRYRLIELLGRGGMGEVWRAHDTVIDRIVAVKVLPAHLADDETFAQRFRREAHAAAQLNNPHVIPIHNSGEIDGRLYVDMRLIEGRDLQTVLADGPLAPARAVPIIEQVAKALHAAHKVGLVHRDVKPSNILLDEDDFAYLIDFGIARGAEETRMTGTGSVIGSWQYMSPERLQAGQVDARCDIYALACVLYECLTGRPPYPGDNLEQQITAHLTAAPPRPSSTDPHVPVAFDAVIATGMAKKPDQRYPTTVELAHAARDAITTPIPAAGPTMQAPPPTRPAAPVESVAPPVDWPTPSGVSPAAPTQLRPPAHATQQRPDLETPRPDETPSARGLRGKRALWAAIAAGVAVGAVVVAVVLVMTNRHSGAGSVSAPSAKGADSTAPTRPRTQIQLPFVGLNGPHGVAVNDAGDLFITDSGNNRVLEMRAGSTTQGELPFTGLGNPVGIAVNPHGDLFVADWNNRRVLELPAGSSAQVVLPISGLEVPIELAVNPAGDLFVTDLANRVHMLPAGANSSITLPFGGLAYPHGIGVNHAGDVFVADTNNNRVVKLAAGSNAQTELPFKGLAGPVGLTVSSHDDVYVTDYSGRRVLELPARSGTQTVLPLTGLTTPAGTAVNASGDVFVTDSTNNWVLKLPAE